MDKIDRGYERQVATQSFFSCRLEKDADYNIVTNPPYILAKEFIEHAIDIVKEGAYVCMLLKIIFF